MCPHGMGLGHLLIDIAIAVPFVAAVLFWLGAQFSKLRKNKMPEHMKRTDFQFVIRKYKEHLIWLHRRQWKYKRDIQLYQRSIGDRWRNWHADLKCNAVIHPKLGLECVPAVSVPVYGRYCTKISRLTKLANANAKEITQLQKELEALKHEPHKHFISGEMDLGPVQASKFVTSHDEFRKVFVKDVKDLNHD